MPIRAVLASGFSIVGLACATAPGDAGREPGASTASAPAQALQGELGGEGPLDTDGLRRSLGKAKLAGFVRLSPTAKLHPTREAAAAAGAPVTTEQGKHAPTTRSGDLARVIEDLGAVVRISTELSRDAPLAPLDARFALEGFVRRDALMPVLTRAKAASMADGSGYALAPGLLVARRGGSLVLADPLLGDVPVALELSDVGLAFESKALPPLPTLDAAAELGCERQRASGRTVVLPMDELTRRTPPEQSDRPFGIDVSPTSEQYPCTFADDAVASVGSRNWRGASELSPCAWGPAIRAYRVGADVLLDVPLPLIVLRVKSTESKLDAGGGCGEGIGSTPTPPPKLVAKPGTRVDFPSRTQAGKYVGPRLPVADLGATGVVCIPVDYVDGGLCFDAADLVEPIVR